MALGISVVVVLWALLVTFIAPTVTPYSRKQWALLMTTLIALWIPMGCYLLFVVAESEHINTDQVVRAGALNLLVGVPLLIFIARKKILKK
jgi:threonine/homoserine/homoserine lactone efflux protein